MKNILILGANGFIGRNLVEFFEKEKNFKIFKPSSTEVDISDEYAVKQLLDENYFDIILHSAVFNPRVGFGKDPSKEIERNLRMFFNFEKYQELYGKMFYFGSGAEFDKTRDIKDADDDFNNNGIPSSDYGLYKYIINKAILYSKNIYNLRIFGLFGQYENWKQTFISGACCKAIKDLPITIRQDVYFDYMYIDDFCKIVKWFIETDPKHKEYNITTGSKERLTDIANIVLDISQKKLPIYICRDGLANEYTAKNQRLLDEIGGFEFTPIYEAIKILYVWYEEHKDEIDIYSLLYQ